MMLVTEVESQSHRVSESKVEEKDKHGQRLQRTRSTVDETNTQLRKLKTSAIPKRRGAQEVQRLQLIYEAEAVGQPQKSYVAYKNRKTTTNRSDHTLEAPRGATGANFL